MLDLDVFIRKTSVNNCAHHLFPRYTTPRSESRYAPQIRTSLNDEIGEIEADAAAPLRELEFFQAEGESETQR